MTVVATRMAPVTRVRRRVASASRAIGWDNSWRATVVLLALVVIRIGELWHPIALTKPVVSTTIAMFVCHWIWSDGRSWRQALASPQVRLACVYGLLVVLLVPTSIWRGRSASIASVMPWAVSLVLLTSLTQPTLLNLDRIVRWFGVLTAFTAFALVLQGNVVEGSRITTSGSYDPNDLGALLALALPFAIGTAMRGRWYQRVIALGCAAIILATLLQTGSRGAFLAMLACLLIFVASLRPSRIAIVAFVAAATIPVFWQFAPDVMRQRASTLLTLDEDYNTTSNSGRIYLWKRGMVFAFRNPLTGVGPGTFEAQLGRDFQETGSRGAWHTAHNTVVQSFAELGLLGGTLLLIMVGRSLWIAGFFWSYRSRVYRPEYMAAFGGYCVAAMFLSHAYNYMLFSVVALSASLEMLKRRVKATPVAPAHSSGSIAPSRR